MNKELDSLLGEAFTVVDERNKSKSTGLEDDKTETTGVTGEVPDLTKTAQEYFNEYPSMDVEFGLGEKLIEDFMFGKITLEDVQNRIEGGERDYDVYRALIKKLSNVDLPNLAELGKISGDQEERYMGEMALILRDKSGTELSGRLSAFFSLAQELAVARDYIETLEARAAAAK